MVYNKQPNKQLTQNNSMLSPQDLKYAQLLSKDFPNIPAVSTEIAHLKAKLELPKLSEHFLSDIHGEFESFNHVLKNGSGIVKKRIAQLFEDVLAEDERKSLATLVYYPEEKFDAEKKAWGETHFKDWLLPRIYQMLDVAQSFASQYAQNQLNGFFNSEYGSLLSELLFAGRGMETHRIYYHQLIMSVWESGQIRGLVSNLSKLIQHLAVGKLHIIGDVYDRGPAAEKIMDVLLNYHSVDFQWGNHDIVWMGAGAGSWACIANVLRVSLRYNNLDTLEDGYGISLLPLATFALEHYKGDKNPNFLPKMRPEEQLNEKDEHLMQIMQKAITIIQFKLEGQIMLRRKSFGIKGRLFLDKINSQKKTVKIGTKVYPLADANFPTIDSNKPYELSPAEQEVMERISNSFIYSEKLQRHVKFLYEKGGMYLVSNNNLLLHGCVPMTAKGDFASFNDKNKKYGGKELFERFDVLARQAYFGGKNSEAKLYGQDIIWYLWCGSYSPIFGKQKMATFESYFVADKNAQREDKNAYYKLRDKPATCEKILKEFGLNPKTAHIVNGHVPVVVKEGEKPVKANGKLLVIDGGFAKAYQEKTGIAGYTLISDSEGLQLVSHESFESAQKAVLEEVDIHSSETILETPANPITIKETDLGKEIEARVKDLEMLLQAYKEGILK
ncbi:MAG: fructose-1,6-bisphosphatase-3 [Arenicella sp.]|jgi:fructose-1,6-bisphosphatase-3